MNAKQTEKALRASLLVKYPASAIAHFGADFLVAHDLCQVADMRIRAARDAERAVESCWEAHAPEVAHRLTDNAKSYRKEAAELVELAKKLVAVSIL